MTGDFKDVVLLTGHLPKNEVRDEEALEILEEVELLARELEEELALI
jgi:hypothetical protein